MSSVKTNIIGRKLIEKRRDTNLSQEALAEKMNVPLETVSSWENGSSVPNFDMLLKLSHVFDSSIEEMTNENYTPEKQSKSEISLGKSLLGTYFGFIIAIYIGTFFQFFPFNLLFNVSDASVILFGLLMISLLIVICTIIVIEEIRGLKKGILPKS